MAWIDAARASEVNGPVATTASPRLGSSRTSWWTTWISGWAWIRWVTSWAKASRSTAKAPPAATLV